MRPAQRVLPLLTSCVILCLAASVAEAQYRGGASSGFSPWLNLYRRDPGPLGPYLSNVRPEQRLRRTLYQQGASLQRQSAGLSTLGEQMTVFGRTGTLRPTGTGSGFMNYSHYYQFQRPMAARRRAMPPPRPARAYVPRGR